MVAFCAARIEIVNRDPDSAKALGSVLQADATFKDRRMIDCAIGRLFEMRSPEADATLAHYADEAAQRFPDSPSTTPDVETIMHRAFVQRIRTELGYFCPTHRKGKISAISGMIRDNPGPSVSAPGQG